MEGSGAEEFTAFVREAEPQLRRALLASCGVELAHDALAEGMAYAWEHWDRVGRMTNPAGYVYRVARSRARPRRSPIVFPDPVGDTAPMVEPGLAKALGSLPERQRVVVALVHGFGWTHAEVSTVLGVSISTVRNHLARGMTRLRHELEVESDERS